MKHLVWGLVILLIIIHQDFWYWSDPTLVFGFMPIGLLYHCGISMGGAFAWFLATIFLWPKELDEAPASSKEGGAA
ncbi:MAG: DUF3311 domain-containing protein [Planctomycetaceae bacterium]|nr:DUF3311 domain-containing protein [Planctomycetaceae bacterium]